MLAYAYSNSKDRSQNIKRVKYTGPRITELGDTKGFWSRNDSVFHGSI